ncbi:kinase-like domain-containing protein, partial [Chytriomyces sp. MP71]
GYGSSATVYIAKYLPLNKIVAVKVIDLDMFERNQIDELRREIQIMSLSRHPNLLPVYGSFVNGAKLFIVTPFLSAGSLLDIMKTAYPHGIEESCIASVLQQALAGLEYLHRNALIHRDVKAGNLLMDEDGLVQLADFGVSSSLSENSMERKGAHRKTFVGTPCWMAPEVMEQSGYDMKADIWSFGITALELATGHAPFAKYPPIKVMMMTLQNDPPTLDREQTRYKYSKSFKDLIDSCLQKDPNKRPTAEKLLQHAFFRNATKNRSHLAKDLLQALPPITKRAHVKKALPVFTDDAKGVSWDFSSVSSDEPRDDVDFTDDEASGIDTAAAETYQPGGSHGHIPMYKPSPLAASGMSEASDESRPGAAPVVVEGLGEGVPNAEIKKGRFSVTGQGQQQASTTGLGTNLAIVDGTSPALSQDSQKSRFVTSDSSSSNSPIMSEASPKQSRFTVTAGQSLVADPLLAPIPMGASYSNDKRSRFAVQSMQAPDSDTQSVSSPTMSTIALGGPPSRIDSTSTIGTNAPAIPAQMASQEASVLHERLDTIQRQNADQQKLLNDLIAMMAKQGMGPVAAGAQATPVTMEDPSFMQTALENRALREENSVLTGRQAELEEQLKAALAQLELLKSQQQQKPQTESTE